MLLTGIVNNGRTLKLQLFVGYLKHIPNLKREQFGDLRMTQLLCLDDWVHCGISSLKREPIVTQCLLSSKQRDSSLDSGDERHGA